MSKGILYFAFNNETIDYLKITEFNYKRAKKHIDVPASIVTSNDCLSTTKADLSQFDNIITMKKTDFQTKIFRNKDDRHKLFWNNNYRTKSYELTPYDETLLIDSDYIIQSDILNKVWNYYFPLAINSDIKLISNSDISSNEKMLHNSSIKTYWATVVYFRKSEITKTFFDILEHVEYNYDYYSRIYHYNKNLFRNDFVFSIAVHMMNDFNETNTIPKLPNNTIKLATEKDTIFEITKNTIKFLSTKNDSNNKTNILPVKTNNDVHITNKLNLLENIGE